MNYRGIEVELSERIETQVLKTELLDCTVTKQKPGMLFVAKSDCGFVFGLDSEKVLSDAKKLVDNYLDSES